MREVAPGKDSLKNPPDWPIKEYPTITDEPGGERFDLIENMMACETMQIGSGCLPRSKTPLAPRPAGGKSSPDWIKKGIPPAPIIFVKLLELFAREDSDSEAITKTIGMDPGLTASLLLMSNSAAFGGFMEVGSVEEAVLRLGINRIRRLVTLLCVEKVIRFPKSPAYKENQLWEHSLTTAIAARQLAVRTGQDEHRAFTAGLLHDLGKILLIQNHPEYGTLFLQSVQEARCLAALETERLGINHSELGCLMLREWKAPVEFCAGIQDHHQPADDLSRIIFLADQMANRLDKGFGCPTSDPALEFLAIQALHLSPQQIEQMGGKVSEEFEREKAALQPAFHRVSDAKPVINLRLQSTGRASP